MPASALQSPGPLSLQRFLAFYETRSEEERWELIDGVAHMMAPPTIRHQRIVSALERALNEVLAARRPDWFAVREIGVELPATPDYRPEPDVVVIDADVDPAARAVTRFHGVAEVLSASDKAIDAKVALYRAHPTARFVLLVRQDEIGATVLSRIDAARWDATTIHGREDKIILRELGCVCALGHLYKGTGLLDGATSP